MVIFHSYVKLPEGSPLCYLCYLFNLFLALASGIPAYGNRLEVRQQDSLQYTAWKTLNNCYKGHIIKRHSHRMPRCFYTPPLMVVSFLFLSCMSGHLTKLTPPHPTPPRSTLPCCPLPVPWCVCSEVILLPVRGWWIYIYIFNKYIINIPVMSTPAE